VQYQNDTGELGRCLPVAANECRGLRDLLVVGCEVCSDFGVAAWSYRWGKVVCCQLKKVCMSFGVVLVINVVLDEIN
jgi:hypothetical protein